MPLVLLLVGVFRSILHCKLHSKFLLILKVRTLLPSSLSTKAIFLVSHTFTSEGSKIPNALRLSPFQLTLGQCFSDLPKRNLKLEIN